MFIGNFTLDKVFENLVEFFCRSTKSSEINAELVSLDLLNLDGETKLFLLVLGSLIDTCSPFGLFVIGL